jgi:3',5'-cyclic AMP phosphodiesterase CpdA
VLHRDGVSGVAVDSTEPDLDHGQIGRGRYRWIEEQFREDADLKIFVLHHHLLPVPGTGRERNVVYDAGDAIECLQRAAVHLVLSGHKHVPYAWKLEDLFIVNTGTVSSLRLRGNTRPCYNVVEISGRTSTSGASTRSTGRADHPVLDRDACSRSTPRASSRRATQS